MLSISAGLGFCGCTENVTWAQLGVFVLILLLILNNSGAVPGAQSLAGLSCESRFYQLPITVQSL